MTKALCSNNLDDEEAFEVQLKEMIKALPVSKGDQRICFWADVKGQLQAWRFEQVNGKKILFELWRSPVGDDNVLLFSCADEAFDQMELRDGVAWTRTTWEVPEDSEELYCWPLIRTVKEFPVLQAADEWDLWEFITDLQYTSDIPYYLKPVG